MGCDWSNILQGNCYKEKNWRRGSSQDMEHFLFNITLAHAAPNLCWFFGLCIVFITTNLLTNLFQAYWVPHKELKLICRQLMSRHPQSHRLRPSCPNLGLFCFDQRLIGLSSWPWHPSSPSACRRPSTRWVCARERVERASLWSWSWHPSSPSA